MSAQQSIDDYSCTPYVHLGAIFLICHDFRWHVQWTTELVIKAFLCLEICSEPEITELDIKVFYRIKQDILRLDISMDYVFGVDIVNGQEKLLCNFNNFVFADEATIF